MVRTTMKTQKQQTKPYVTCIVFYYNTQKPNKVQAHQITHYIHSQLLLQLQIVQVKNIQRFITFRFYAKICSIFLFYTLCIRSLVTFSLNLLNRVVTFFIISINPPFANLCYHMSFVLIIVITAAVAGILWSYHHYNALKSVSLATAQSHTHLFEDEVALDDDKPQTSVIQIGKIIHEGASEFIASEYKICSIFIILMSIVVFFCVDQAQHCYTTFSFLLGAVTSMFCGALGMKIATYSNYRTTIEAKISLGRAFITAYRAGCIMGFVLVSTSMLVLLTLIFIYTQLMDLSEKSSNRNHYEQLFETVAGYGLGGSSVALFARVGGGIFTKAADLGSDLVGKIESNLPEDSPKNPATIADNVGDNVGDVAGMGADLFGSFAESTCAALVIASNSLSIPHNDTLSFQLQSLLYVLMIPALGIILCIIVSALITETSEITQNQEVESSLKKQLVYSTILLLPAIYFLTEYFLPSFHLTPTTGPLTPSPVTLKTSFDIFSCVSVGLVAGLIIGYFTQIMTSYTYRPVRQLSDSCRTGPATNVIYGLALGYLSTIVPVIVLCAVCYYSHHTMGYYGVSLSALGMLSNLPICLAIDSYGPIADNAGGIAEMAELNFQVRKRTDVLDAAGNTTAAVGKGFAIGSATLVGFALYGGFLHRVQSLTPKGDKTATVSQSGFDDPLIFTSLLFGAMIPYAFSALTMKSVGQAALGMIQEVRRQIRFNPGILNGTASPDYRSCVRISTQASLREMILPGLLVTVTPFTLGFFFGPKALLGFLPGAIVSGVQMAISASNTGGAWDNAKKYIEAGLMKDEEGNVISKGSQIHKAAVIGDTVGDPLKDTSGPSLNILIKLMAILSLVFSKYFAEN